MIAERRSRVIDRIVLSTCGKIVRVATSASAVVVPSRSPTIVDVRCGRATSVATTVAATWRSGRRGRSRRQVDGVASSRVLLSVGKQAHATANIVRDLLESERIEFGTASATRGIADVDHAWCRCGDRDGWRSHIAGRDIGIRGIGIDVVRRDNHRGEFGIETFAGAVIMFVLQFTKTTMLSFEDVRVVDAGVLEVCIETSEVLLAEVLRGLDGAVDQLLLVSIVKRSRSNVCKRLPIAMLICVLTKCFGSHSTTAD